MPLDVGPLACCEMGTSLHQEELILYHHYMDIPPNRLAGYFAVYQIELKGTVGKGVIVL